MNARKLPAPGSSAPWRIGGYSPSFCLGPDRGRQGRDRKRLTGIAGDGAVAIQQIALAVARQLLVLAVKNPHLKPAQLAVQKVRAIADRADRGKELCPGQRRLASCQSADFAIQNLRACCASRVVQLAGRISNANPIQLQIAPAKPASDLACIIIQNQIKKALSAASLAGPQNRIPGMDQPARQGKAG